MKKYLILPLSLLIALSVQAQTPKKHVFYDTVKTVKERVDYSPDTIPVFFKELEIRDGNTVVEKWQNGFVIWQTYKKSFGLSTTLTSSGTAYYSSTFPVETVLYYKDEYVASPTLTEKFLYFNKTPVKNKVIFSIKR